MAGGKWRMRPMPVVAGRVVEPRGSRSIGLSRSAGQLQMGRKGNSGPYAPENVECVTKEQKQRSQLIALSVSAFSPERRAEAAKKSGLARRGANNRRAKSVVTPLGTFVTVKAAA